MIAALQSLWAWFTSTIAGKVLISCFVSMLPVVELRGGIPIAVGCGRSTKLSIPICIIGNCIPIIPILILFQRVLRWMRHRGGAVGRFALWLERHCTKHRGFLDRYAGAALFVLTAVPLPGTGAWTASMLAALAGVRIRNAAPAITLGVLAAGAIVSVVSYGVASLF